MTGFREIGHQTGPPFSINEISVISLDVDTRPKDADMVLPIAKSTIVSLPNRHDAFFYAAQAETLTLRDLDGLVEKCLARDPGPSTPVSQPRTALIRWTFASGIVLVACLLIFILRRARGVRS